TAFSMRGDLVKKEPGILDAWNKMDLYRRMLERRKGSKPFVLHDGPPYANGNIHIGHALNKILKDIVVKSRAMMGYYTPYVPGWDCHGLPIEQQLLKELKLGKRHIEDIPAFRRSARDFAARFIEIQRAEFKRLGILGAWDKPYVTMSKDYEGTVIRAFRELLEKGLIHRDKKTIYWCVSCETALADAEVEYKDKTSPSIYVRFPLETLPEGLPPSAKGRTSIVIWTTTPWTLPSNMAAAVSKTEDYRLLEADGQYLFAADKLADTFLAETGLEAAKGAVIPGEKLVGLKYTHCLCAHLPESRRFPRQVIATDFVDMSTGTGIVHIAPGHGEEDFHAGKKWGLEIFCPVKEDGRFNADAGIFEGMKVFESNEKVVETLKADGMLLAHKKIAHSYPHCWRCKQPIIFRATEQWFLKVDKDGLREKLMKAADGVCWHPEAGHDRMIGMLKTRPDWCLSRQRYWGTPIIAVYCKKCGKLQEDNAFLKRMEERVMEEGSDFWFSEPVEDLLAPGVKCSCGSELFSKEKDIMDVWLDSGVSWYAVIKNGMLGPGEFFPADLYLEGSDQHRGWFQTSLIPSVALHGHPPYRAVLTHGMVLDESGHAMHKSMGNNVSPQEVVSRYGADILRLWVALCDYSEDVRISEKLLSGPIDTYRKIRNTMRYLLGNLSDFKPSVHRVPDEALVETDRYMRARLAVTAAAVEKHYENFQFRPAMRAIADFCILDLSAFYLDCLKDRLYTFSPDAPERRSAQTVLYDTLTAVLRMMAPVLSFTAEEGWRTARAEIAPELEESVFLTDYPRFPAGWADQALLERWERVMSVREAVTAAIEEVRKTGVVGASLEARVVLRTSDPGMKTFLDSAAALWPQVAIVSECAVELDAAAPELEVKVFAAEGSKCPRCWQRRRDIGSDPSFSDLCGRCASVLKDSPKG
ncbi:MAG: isoleucine--tRNA ligase, partial [Elusimicrobia bacterium CG08_land_8_20_14_0_20_59_10]